ncbi:M3 family oligoendopeptidase [Alicyclobacillus fastidiosus]|uniref:M3 family oligoendopeptidase n=1 Tax=Alicyclobacillus fastidiosus TaxID=392011 RepID=A0ABV5A9Q3_9BACL|nr:M3 family oligoendopeptidase [Alicyclobacillus fastidiosus]WEH10925.1 M3 family oligoendopeptidase [Alicyclobacillus fastidiosus]
MSGLRNSPKYYLDDIDLKDVKALEMRLEALVQGEIKSVADLEDWIDLERTLMGRIQEAVTGHKIDFYRDTGNKLKRDMHLHDQTVVQPILLKYQGELDKKFCSCRFTGELHDSRYGAMKRVRTARLQRFCEVNIPLTVREKKLGVKYSEIRGAMTVDWEGETKPYAFVQALLDHQDRTIRQSAWMALAEARNKVKPDIDDIMNELVRLRHEMALNAGFGNYRDYMFQAKNREYSVQDCYDFHRAVERYIVPAWNRLADVFRSELGVNTYRPWDSTAKMLHSMPYTTVTELMDGVHAMLEKTDAYFAERFAFMRQHRLLDVESRPGKQMGGFMDPLPASKNAFVFANFSPSFTAIIALIHEMGHAIHIYLNNDFDEQNWRDEVTELYSHGMELLLLDRLGTFYPNEQEFKRAQREELRRSLGLLIGPLTRDMFEHWMYTHPDHTAQERDRKYLEICKRFRLSPVDASGLESEVAASWFDTIHFFLYPFYAIEYSISELGALQLFELYRADPKRGVTLYKQGASTDFNDSISDIYRRTGIEFDFSERIVKRIGEFLESQIEQLR